MIKFFRSIRRKLFSEGRISKYLVYAIGEIILVMIGILLALQVNSWHNGRLEIKKEQALLKNLEVDFNNNIENLNMVIENFEEAYNASVVLLNILKSNEQINNDEIDGLIDDIINKTMSYDLISGSINEIFNTGSLHLIGDPTLRKQISNWSYFFSDTEDDIIIYRNYLFDFFIPSLTSKVRLRNLSLPDLFEKDLGLQLISNSDFEPDYQKLRNLKFENEVYNNALNYMYVINSYKVFHKYLTETLALIESNID